MKLNSPKTYLLIGLKTNMYAKHPIFFKYIIANIGITRLAKMKNKAVFAPEFSNISGLATFSRADTTQKRKAKHDR